MSPPNLDFNPFEEIFEIVKNATFNKTGRYHEKKSYDEVFIDGVWGRKPGDIVVLLFSLDTKERIPSGYEDLLARDWSGIEKALEGGETVELQGKAREMNIILLAAPKMSRLRQLIKESSLLDALKK
jgi:hypothetical protein